MSIADAASANRPFPSSFANAVLKGSAVLWFLTALLGQWLFAFYMVVFYGGAAARGDWSAWTRRLFHGIVEGDATGNVAVVAHIALAFVITFCGPLQLVPQIRAHAISLHRWNGRIYLSTAFIISVGALCMVWTRGVLGGMINAIGFTTLVVDEVFARRNSGR